MGGIQSESVLPGDPTFNIIDNKYDIPSFKRCAEFNIEFNRFYLDFRFKRGSNHGLGKVFIYVSRAGVVLTVTSYPGPNKFGDEGGNASKGNLIYFIRNDDDTERQFKYFMIEDSSGLSQAGLARLNQSIEAFVFSRSPGSGEIIHSRKFRKCQRSTD